MFKPFNETNSLNDVKAIIYLDKIKRKKHGNNREYLLGSYQNSF